MERMDLYRLTGSSDQLFGIRDYSLHGGKAERMRALELYNQSGLSLTVLPDRGMDLAALKYRGTNLSFLSHTGLVSSAYFQEDGSRGFMRSFQVGFLTTCGLSYMGATCQEDDRVLGLHGVISNTPAEEAGYTVDIDDGGALLRIRGKVRESEVFGPHLVLTREITSRDDESSFCITDTIENQGLEPSTFMMLYHLNFGYPMLSPDCELLLPTKHVMPRDQEAQLGVKEYLKIEYPKDGGKEQVFFHEMKADEHGQVEVMLYNPKEQMGVTITYPYEALPYFTQWKCMRSGEYVLGLEPGNCQVNGKVKEQQEGRVRYLGPGEKARHQIHVAVASGDKASASRDRWIQRWQERNNT